MPDAVLFDFNGVLVDDERLHFECFNEVLAPLGVAMSADEYAERYLGFDDRGAFSAVLRDRGRDHGHETVAGLIARKSVAYARRARDELVIFPGAAELVSLAADASPVAVVSGALRAEIEGALALMRVRERVAFIVAAEDVAACKPDPEGYARAVGLLSRAHPALRAARVVALEDSVAGVESAVAAGVVAAAVAHEPDALLRAGARAVFPRVADVTPAALDALLD